MQHVRRGNDSTPGAFLVTAVQCNRFCKGDGKLCSGQGDGECAFLAVMQLAVLLQLGGAMLLVPACNQAFHAESNGRKECECRYCVSFSGCSDG